MPAANQPPIPEKPQPSVKQSLDAQQQADLERLLRDIPPVERPIEDRPHLTRPPRRYQPASLYEAIIGKVALSLILLIIVAVWFTGGYFTLQWLDSIGLPVIALGSVAWAIPIAVSILEVGIVMLRTRTVWARIPWALVLTFDAYSTAVGGISFAHDRGWVSTVDLTIHIIGGLIGLAIALIPEPAGRAIVQELRS